jgi:hypothetical protein
MGVTMTASGQSDAAEGAAPGGPAADPVPETAGAASAAGGSSGADPGVLTGPSVTAAPVAADPAEGSESGSGSGAGPGVGTAGAGTPGPPASSAPIVTDPAFTPPPTDYTDAGVPSMDFVRDKIEGRYANALGSAELAEEVLPEVKSMRERAAEREEAGRDKLEAIRRSMRGESES